MHHATWRVRIASTVLLPMAALLIFPGCGGPGDGLWVTGKLMKAGAAYSAPAGQLLGITFVVVEVNDKAIKGVQQGDQFRADYDPTGGTFSVPGPEGKGIPAGKYRVALIQKLSREAFNAANPKLGRGTPDREADMLNDKYGVATSPIVVDLTKSTDLKIDLDRPTGP